jgi:hypothetical protein
VTINGLDAGVMASEVLYAAAGGIDYFVFGLYDDRRPDGSDNQIMANFRHSIDLFTALSSKHGMRFSVFMNATAMAPRVRQLLAGYVAAPSFLRTPDGRPVVFWFMPKAKTWVEDAGGLAAARSRLRQLRADIAEAAGEPPYLVVMAFDPADGARLVGSVGFDAFTSYGNPLGSREPGAASGEEPYTRCEASSRYYWALAHRSDEPFMPPVSLGWDYRPTIDDPSRGKDPAWCRPPTTEEIRDLVRGAASAAPQQQVIRSILIYAWNEYTEGGWLAPTLCDGAQRLAAVAAAFHRESQLSTALRSAPLPRAPADCSARREPPNNAQ